MRSISVWHGCLNQPVDELLDALGGVRVPADGETRLSAALRPGLHALVSEKAVGNGDLLLPGGCRRIPDAAVLGPGARLELQPAIYAVPGVGVPVAAGLALRDRVPVRSRVGARLAGRRTQGRGNEAANDGGL